MQFLVNGMPIHYSSMCRCRKRIGESGVRKLLKETIKAGLKLKIIKNDQFEDINVDNTVQEKYVRFPTYSRLYFRVIQRLVKLANKLNIKLRLKYINLSKHFLYNQIRYINTKQTEKVEEYTTKFKACLDEIIKDFENSNPVFNTKTRLLFITAKRIYFKVYRFHAPKVECIAKGKNT